MKDFLQRATHKARVGMAHPVQREAVPCEHLCLASRLHPYQAEMRQHALMIRYWLRQGETEQAKYCLNLACMYRDLYRKMVIGRAGA